MPIWGFIFMLAALVVFLIAAWIARSLVALGLGLLAALVVFLIAAWIARSLVALGLGLLAAALILTYCTSSSPVHF